MASYQAVAKIPLNFRNRIGNLAREAMFSAMVALGARSSRGDYLRQARYAQILARSFTGREGLCTQKVYRSR